VFSFWLFTEELSQKPRVHGLNFEAGREHFFLWVGSDRGNPGGPAFPSRRPVFREAINEDQLEGRTYRLQNCEARRSEILLL